MGYGKGYRSGMMCVCDCKVVTGYQCNSAQNWHMMSPQLSEKGFCCWESWSSRVDPKETALPHRTENCPLFVHLKILRSKRLLRQITVGSLTGIPETSGISVRYEKKKLNISVQWWIQYLLNRTGKLHISVQWRIQDFHYDEQNLIFLSLWEMFWSREKLKVTGTRKQRRQAQHDYYIGSFQLFCQIS